MNKYAYKKKVELKYTKINELKEDMYNKYNICKDGKNKCLIYFINQENLNDDEIKVLTTIGNKYKTIILKFIILMLKDIIIFMIILK